MKRVLKVITLAVIILLLFSMNISGGKKGIAGPGGCPDIPDLPLLYNVLGVDWAYTWATCLWPMPSIEYVPMVRSIHNGFNSDKAQQVVTHYGAGGYWLVGNEPGSKQQDNLSPMEAAAAYGDIINTILSTDPNAKIILGNFVSPSLYFRNTWFSQFKSAWVTIWNEDVTARIIGWGVHAYVRPYTTETYQNAIDRVQRQILAWKLANPGCQLWITEFGNIDRVSSNEFGNETETNIEIMRQMTIWLDANVDRYAMFYFGDEAGDWDFTSLYTEPWPLPMLTKLGEAYIHLPVITPTLVLILTYTPLPIHTHTVTPSSTIVPSITNTFTPSPSNTTLDILTTPAATLAPTKVLIPTLPPNPPMPDTMLGVAQEQLRVTWRLEKWLYAISVIVTGGIAYVVKTMREINSRG